MEKMSMEKLRKIHKEQIEASKQSNLATIKYYTDLGKPVPAAARKMMAKNTEFHKKYTMGGK